MLPTVAAHSSSLRPDSQPSDLVPILTRSDLKLLYLISSLARRLVTRAAGQIPGRGVIDISDFIEFV